MKQREWLADPAVDQLELLRELGLTQELAGQWGRCRGVVDWLLRVLEDRCRAELREAKDVVTLGTAKGLQKAAAGVKYDYERIRTALKEAGYDEGLV